MCETKVPLAIATVSLDIFDAPHSSIIVHACNTAGYWGAGVAKTIKSRYQDTYEQYQEYCRTQRSKDILGKCILYTPRNASTRKGSKCKGHWIACLLVKNRIGSLKRKPSQKEQDDVLKYTASAMKELLELVESARRLARSPIGNIHMPKINSGLFGVPWEQTLKVLKTIQGAGKEPYLVVVHERDN